MSHSSGLSHQHTASHLAQPLLPIEWQHLPRLKKEKLTAQILDASPLQPHTPLRTDSDSCLYFLIQSRHWSNDSLWYAIALFSYLVAFSKSTKHRSTKHIYSFLFSMILFLQPSQNKYGINCHSLSHKTKLHFINIIHYHYSTQPFLWHPFHHFYSMLMKLHDYSNCSSYCHHNCKKIWWKTSSGWQERHILTAQIGLPTQSQRFYRLMPLYSTLIYWT